VRKYTFLIISQINFDYLEKIMLFHQNISAINHLTLQIMEIIQNSTKVTVEFDVSPNEMLNLCLKDKILQSLEEK